MTEGHLRAVCAWCNRTRNARGEWHEREEPEASPATATHGICPDCLERATARATMAAAATA
jgi:hypothetical protein